MPEPVVIFVARDFPQAYLLRAALAAEGIEAFVLNENLRAAVGELPLGWATAARLMVAAEDEERAREVLRELGEDA
jgi:hypothetical protein